MSKQPFSPPRPPAAHYLGGCGRAIARIVLIAATSLALLLSACGGGDSKDSPGQPGGGSPARESIAWPTTLELGMAGGLGSASATRQIAPFPFRYQYLAGGAQKGWQTWERGSGTFVGDYIRESREASMIPVFTYYMLLQSTPDSGDEASRLERGLRDAKTMRAWFDDLRVFFQRAAESGGLTVLHVEPDLWGFMQRANGDDSTKVAVKVAGSGVRELQGLPDNGAGFAQAVVRLRNTYAPGVTLGYHFSAWATGTDPFISNSSEQEVARIADAGAAFYRSLRANFDLVFAEFSDRDAAFKQDQYGDAGASWWDESDFARHLELIRGFNSATELPIVLWQIPLGNTKMRAMDNTWNHYQDTRVEWLLDGDGAEHLAAYRDAGVVAFLFGRGADGATDASDANGDGVTNPPAINGNDRESLSAADDGGYFAERAAAFYARARVRLR